MTELSSFQFENQNQASAVPVVAVPVVAVPVVAVAQPVNVSQSRSSLNLVLTPPGQFFHRGCFIRFLQVLAVFVIFGAIAFAGLKGLAKLVPVLGPALVIVAMMSSRYAVSVDNRQTVCTFLEAIAWMVPLIFILGYVDLFSGAYLTTRSTSTHECKFPTHGIGAQTWLEAMVLVSEGKVPTIPANYVDKQQATRLGMRWEVPVGTMANLFMEDICSLGSYGQLSANSMLYFDSATRGSLNADTSPAGFANAGSELYPGSPDDDDEPLVVKFSILRTHGWLYYTFQAFFRAAFMEESLKYVALRRILFKDIVVDCGSLIVYGLAAAAGFAAAENVQYCFGPQGGASTMVMRMVMAIPLHCITGIIIGTNLGKRKFLGQGYTYLVALGVPVLIHGGYDWVLFVEPLTGYGGFVAMILAVSILCMGCAYGRCAWLQIDNVCVVDLKMLLQQGRVSPPQCCCQCSGGWTVRQDPLLRRHSVIERFGAIRQQFGTVSGNILPEAPACQTVLARCEGCSNNVYRNFVYPCHCPYCGQLQSSPNSV